LGWVTPFDEFFWLELLRFAERLLDDFEFFEVLELDFDELLEAGRLLEMVLTGQLLSVLT
jgi:hypothetical protein